MSPVKSNEFEYDTKSGLFIVTVHIPADKYGIFAQHKIIADIEKVIYERHMEAFKVPVYMTPEEYTAFAKDQRLPEKY